MRRQPDIQHLGSAYWFLGCAVTITKPRFFLETGSWVFIAVHRRLASTQKKALFKGGDIQNEKLGIFLVVGTDRGEMTAVAGLSQSFPLKIHSQELICTL